MEWSTYHHQINPFNDMSTMHTSFTLQQLYCFIHNQEKYEIDAFIFCLLLHIFKHLLNNQDGSGILQNMMLYSKGSTIMLGRVYIKPSLFLIVQHTSNSTTSFLSFVNYLMMMSVPKFITMRK